MVTVLAAGLLVLRDAGAANVPSTGPATRPASTQPDAAADGWAGEYHRLGGWHIKDDESSFVVLVKVGDAYRLRNTRYDDYDFVEEKPGLLWDRRHVIGTITRGTLAFEAPSRVGPRGPVTVLEAQFCYESFYLFGGAAPEVPGQARATRPAALPATGRGRP
jgi:hypothetical protein